MYSLRQLLVMYTLSVWTVCATDCGDRKTWINGRCCDLCPPGEHLKEFCTEHQQTNCSPCANGTYSAHYSIFDRCEECQVCQQEFAEKCTTTTNAKCLCRSGFLCSNNVCSVCEENKCVTGERLKRTEMSTGRDLIYLYECESICPDHYYFDVKAGICKPWTQCSAFGLAEVFPGNITHNSVCDVRALTGNQDAISLILGISFAVFALGFLVFLFLCIAYFKKLRRRKENNNTVMAVPSNTTDFHLSKEESGLQLIIQDESKDASNLDQLHEGNDTTF